MCVQLTPVGTSVATVKTVDADTGVNALVEYLVIPGNVPEEELQKGRVSDGVKHFKMKSSNSGEVTLQKGLDFEKVQKYFVTIQAMVRLIYIYIFIYGIFKIDLLMIFKSSSFIRLIGFDFSTVFN